MVEAGGQRIAIFNLGGKYYAIEDRCSHRGGPLSEGMLAEDEVICPWHGSRFNAKTGAVLMPPAQRNVRRAGRAAGPRGRCTRRRPPQYRPSPGLAYLLGSMPAASKSVETLTSRQRSASAARAVSAWPVT